MKIGIKLSANHSDQAVEKLEAVIHRHLNNYAAANGIYVYAGSTLDVSIGQIHA